MAIWKRILFRGKRAIAMRSKGDSTPGALIGRRLTGVELMEARCLLSVSPINAGVVYIEQDGGSDIQGDLFEVTFAGGVDGTTLDRLRIDGDQQIRGFSVGDVFFDVAAGGLGADYSSAFQRIDDADIDGVRATVLDGSSQLLLEFDGFEAGERLRFRIDVDEVEDYDATETDLSLMNDGFDPITSGVEFQGSTLFAEFSAENFYAVDGSAEFRNRYDTDLAASGLDLPADDETNQRDRTAGAFVMDLKQQPVPTTLSGYVYHDRNDDGLRDANEEGLEGVTVRVVPIDTVVPQSTVTVTTDAQGYYDAGPLAPGTYRVVEVTQPDGFLDGKDAAGLVGGQVVGTAVDDEIGQISLSGGDVGTEFNFGELVPITMGGRVHISNSNGDCFGADQHEPVAGAIVQLLDAGGDVIDETFTDSDGEYEFAGLRPGRYGLREITPDPLLDGGAQVGSVDGQPKGRVADDGTVRQIDLSSGDMATNFDFCENEPATLSGNVFHDRNNDGTRDDGEEGIGQVFISLLDENDVTVAVELTDANGQYAFGRLSAGEYTIVETQPVGYVDGSDSPGTIFEVVVGQAIHPGDRIGRIQVPFGAAGVDYNFGEYRTAAIRGRIQTSTREGDCFGGSEDHRPIGAATVQLLDASGNVLAETQSNTNGEYAFEGLTPGDYRVRELTPDGLLDGGARPGTIDGWTMGSVDATGTVRDILLGSDQTAVDVDFCENVPATIGGSVYHDANDNGFRDDNEDPIAGVDLELLDAQRNVVAVETSNADGLYQFVGLTAGNVSIREIHPDGYLDGKDSPGTLGGIGVGTADRPGDAIRGIAIGFADVGRDYNFGELLPGSISGSVHADRARDCFFDSDDGDVLLADVTIQLLDATGNVLNSTVTNAAGEYSFTNLNPGTYTVRQIQGNDYFDGDQAAGSHGGDDSVPNEIRQVTVGSNELLTDYDFCDVPPSALSGYVFIDGEPIDVPQGGSPPERIAEVRDGERTPDDTMLPGVSLELRDGVTGEVVMAQTHALPGVYVAGPITTTTDANGLYEFQGLRPGQYAVYQRQPAGAFVDGVDTPGSTSGIVFNPGEPHDTVALARLTVPPQNDAIVRIGLAPGVSSLENNFSEVTVREAPPELIPETPERPFRPVRPPTTPTPPPRPPQVGYTTSTPSLSPRLAGYTVKPIGSIASGGKPRTWHLSIMNGGQPRGEGIQTKSEGSIWFTAADSGRLDHSLDGGTWLLPTAYGSEAQTPTRLRFGRAGGVPVVGDFDGDGFDEIGVFVGGEWFIDMNGDGKWGHGDLWARLGNSKDMPVTGDWDGDGKWDIGIFGREWSGDPHAMSNEPGLPDSQNMTVDEFKNMPPLKNDATNRARLLRHTSRDPIRADVIDHVFRFGRKDDFAVAGDWNGDGISSIGVFRRGRWYLDVDGNGRWSDADRAPRFGRDGDVPLAGDFDGDGADDLAVFRNGVFIIDSNGNGKIDASDERIAVGQPGDYPVVGDFDGDGKDEVAVYRANGSTPEIYQAKRAG